ncbi:puratrophin-1 [Hoplias malabaricus]|uniref:puratrophin-1 n=1 Tax=Hoplias malabaricus TaxID=27720 RepID=UPI0034636823
MSPVGWVSPNTWDSRSFGRDHIGPVDIPKGEDSSVYSGTQPRTPAPATSGHTYRNCPTPHDHSTPHDRPTCVRTVRFAEQPCTPRMQRKHRHGVKEQECPRRESYRGAQQSPVSTKKHLQEPISSPSSSIKIQSKTLHRSVLEHSKQYPQSATADRNIPESSQDTSADVTPHREGTITCFTPTVIGTSEKCHVVFQGQPSEGSRGSHLEMIPRLHVVHGKKTTTFGLVSPKLNRRRLRKQDDPEDPNTSPPVNGPWTNTLMSSSQPHTDDMEMPRTQASSPATSKPEAYLLQSGMVCLTGGRDRWNRAVVEVYGDDQYWRSPVSSLELSQLLLYFHTITRKEVRKLGMAIVYDARTTPPHIKFLKALQLVQEQDPQAVCSVLLLMNKEKSQNQEKYPGGMEVMSSLKVLNKFVESSQLTSFLGGSFPYSHRDWLDLHQELHPFVLDLKEATNLLLEAIRKLEGVHKIDSVQDVQQCISDQKALMKEVLEDTRLVALQREGGAMLARLRWESDVRATYCEENRVVMDIVEDLYNQVEEQVHVLARKSNMSLQQLHFLLQLRELESRFAKIREWFDLEGERHLLESVEESSLRLQEILQSFTTFLSEANEQKLQVMMLVTEAENIQGPNYPETEVFHTMVSIFKSRVSDFLSRADKCCEEMETMVNLCQFCETAIDVANECSQQLEQEQLECMTQQEKQATLQNCHEKMSKFSPECFQEAKAQACSLEISRAMQVWNMAWETCQGVSRQLEECLQNLEKAQHPLVPLPLHYEWQGDESTCTTATDRPAVLRRKHLDHSDDKVCRDRDSIHGTVTCFNINFRQSRKGHKVSKASQAADQNPTDYIRNSPRKNSHEHKQKTIQSSGTVGCQWIPWQHNSRRHNTEDSVSAFSSPKSQTCLEPQISALDNESQIPDHSIPGDQSKLTNYPQTHSSHRALQTAVDYQHSHPGSLCSEESYTETEHHGLTFHSKEAVRWRNDADLSRAGTAIKLQRIMEELLLTELEYVRSLGYILTNYMPLLARPDIPPDLRGQRGRIFGNLEKLHHFHCHYFLPELEACRSEPLRVGRCFLRHTENFGLYALYSKNKPQSDALIQHHKFFKCKQQELRDSMDLSSYLLKPVQRISKYSLLLQEMVGECLPGQDSERQEIQAAAEVIRFQLRHGNDLLTMDAIRNCDVNLKEQGQLVRQDEFYVMMRKKKALRRVFLFQELILFTKPKKTHRGDDVYFYKQSFKTSDIGLTHNSGESGLCFEIWYRRRRAQDTYILQAESQDIKQAWTEDLEQILWEQALKNRELRRQECVFMGVGSKAFVDIQSSEGAIHDRAVTCFLSGKDAGGLLKTPSHMVSSLQKEMALPRPESIGSRSNASTSGSQSSSSSGRGSLSPNSFHGNQVHGSSHRLYLTPENLIGHDHQSRCHLTGPAAETGDGCERRDERCSN